MSDIVIKNEEVLALLTQDPNFGTEDMGETGGLPLIKITSSMSQDNLLTDGSSSQVGKIYHTELKQDFDELKVNITYIGQFSLPDFVTKEPKMTYVMGGVLRADNAPFVMFAKGFSLQNTWNFSGEVTNIRNRFKLPMYCLNITLTTEKRPHEKYKSVPVWKWVIERKNDVPIIEQDLGRLTFLKDSVSIFKDRIAQMVKSEEENDVYIDQHNREVEEIKNAIDGK